MDILQRLIGALVDDAYDAVYVEGNGLLDGVAYLAGEFVGSEYAFLQGDVFFYKFLGNSSLFVGINVYLPRIIVRIFVDFD